MIWFDFYPSQIFAGMVGFSTYKGMETYKDRWIWKQGISVSQAVRHELILYSCLRPFRLHGLVYPMQMHLKQNSDWEFTRATWMNITSSGNRIPSGISCTVNLGRQEFYLKPPYSIILCKGSRVMKYESITYNLESVIYQRKACVICLLKYTFSYVLFVLLFL